MIGQEEENHGGKQMKRSRHYPQPIENALEMWVQKMEDLGFPPKLDIFKAMALELAEQNAEQKGDSKLGKTWLDSFLNRHSSFSSKFGSNLDSHVHWQVAPGPLSTISISFRRPSRSTTSYPKIYMIWMKRALH